VTLVISVRSETPDDYEEIHRVTVEAFTGSEFGHNGEAELVDSLRAKSVDQLSLVACLDDEIVGHILFTPVTIRTPQHELSGMGLAPLSVAPKHQHAGIGSALVTDGLGQLFERGCLFVVVLGHPEYYRRFGFLPASQFEVSHGFAGLPQEVFFILPRSGGSLADMMGGAVYYHGEFGPQHSGE
jgi:putative acetyltransferase